MNGDVSTGWLAFEEIGCLNRNRLWSDISQSVEASRLKRLKRKINLDDSIADRMLALMFIMARQNVCFECSTSSACIT